MLSHPCAGHTTAGRFPSDGKMALCDSQFGGGHGSDENFPELAPRPISEEIRLSSSRRPFHSANWPARFVQLGPRGSGHPAPPPATAETCRRLASLTRLSNWSPLASCKRQT